MTTIFLGEPSANVKRWIIDHYAPTPTPPNGKVWFKTSSEQTDWSEEDANINDGAFNGFESKYDAVEVIIPAKDASGNDVTSISDSVFYNCSGLTSVTIPDSITNIGDWAFCDCSELTSVTIPGSVTNIGQYAFYSCIGLTSVTIPNSVTSIRDEAFYNCSSLTSVTIPDSVTSIWEGAFSGCSGLTSVTIPNSVTSIGADAFYNCISITDVYCYPNPTNLLWEESSKDDFKSDGSTRCHVKAEYLTAYQTKFGSEVNVTFVGDLT